jgi:FAD/FMN-containing dehydrogenase
MTIDNLVSTDVITADGKKLRASEQDNPELFWALRGGGGNFGVVIQFEFALHPVGPEILARLLVFPFAQAKQVLTRYRQFANTAPEDLSVWVCFARRRRYLFFRKMFMARRLSFCQSFTQVQLRKAG